MNMRDIIALLSVAAAIFAWIAKLRWSKEYTDTKNAEIENIKTQVETKNAEIFFLKSQLELQKEFTSTKLREHFLSTKEELEKIIDEQKMKLSETKAKLQSISDENARLRNSDNENTILNHAVNNSKISIIHKSDLIDNMQNGLDSIRVALKRSESELSEQVYEQDKKSKENIKAMDVVSESRFVTFLTSRGIPLDVIISAIQGSYNLDDFWKKVEPHCKSGSLMQYNLNISDVTIGINRLRDKLGIPPLN
ncbi:MAG: hypothetical protein WC156_15140 [Pedobacter sp.]